MSLYEAEFLGAAKAVGKKVEKPKRVAKKVAVAKEVIGKKQPKPKAVKKDKKEPLEDKEPKQAPTPEPSEDGIGKAVDEAMTRKRKAPEEYLTAAQAKKLFKRIHEEGLKRENALRKKDDQLPKEIAHAVADKQWEDEGIRKKVQRAENSHQARMFRMVHGRELAI